MECRGRSNGEVILHGNASEIRDETTVTVVIPAFNREATIGRALESLRVQTYPHWRAIVVDDGSTDGTVELARSIAAEDSRIQVFTSGSRGGAQAARNVGIRMAKTEWIAFLDSDDEWYPQSLSTRVEEAVRTGTEVIHTAADVVENGRKQPFPVPPMRGNIYEQILRGPGPMFQGLLVKRAAMEEIGGLDESIAAYQEWDTCIRLAKIRTFGFIERATFAWSVGRSDAISADWAKGAMGYQQVLQKHFSEMQRLGGRGLIGRHYSAIAAHFHRAGLQSKAVGMHLRALASAPHELQTYIETFRTIRSAATGKLLSSNVKRISLLG